MDKISIIIPVYNVEPFIRRCLDSVINQTYTNLEILCIDDGSTDNSGIICDEYSALDSRIRVFHQNNNGLSHARNVGLQNATGVYVGFVDPDDWIEFEMYEVLHSLIREYNVSFSAVAKSVETDTETIVATEPEIVPKGLLRQDELMQYTYKIPYMSGLMVCACNKLYSMEFLSNNRLHFDESVTTSEDTLFTCRLLLCEGCTGTYLPKPLYHHYQRSTSLTKNRTYEYNAIRLNVSKMCIEMLEGKGFEQIRNLWKRSHGYDASVYLEAALIDGDIQQAAFMKNEMKRYLAEYLELNQAHPSRIERFNRLLGENM